MRISDEKRNAATVAVEALSLAALMYEAMKLGSEPAFDVGDVRSQAERAVAELYAEAGVPAGSVIWARLTTGALALEAHARGVPDCEWAKQANGRSKLVEALIIHAEGSATAGAGGG